MTAIPKGSPVYTMMVDYGNAKTELQRLLDDNPFAKKHERANQLKQQIAEMEQTIVPAARHGLSGRELETLTLLADGHELVDIGRKLHISRHTARTYQNTAKKKLGARTKTQAVARATALGLIKVA